MLISLYSCAVTALLFSAGRAPSAPIADVFVDTNGVSCAVGDGSAANPVCTISAGVALANSGDTIRIAPGTYIENLNLNFDVNLIGTGGSLVTIVDGNAAGSVIRIPVAVTVTLDGLTITNGSAVIGGGILTDGNLTLRNSTVSGNRTNGMTLYYQAGGGIGTRTLNNNVPVVTIENCQIINNRVYSQNYGRGAGIYMFGGELTIRDSLIANNYNLADGAPEGGGILTRSVSLVMSGTTVRDNFGSFANGIVQFTSSMNIDSSTLTDFVWTNAASEFVLTNSTVTGGMNMLNTHLGTSSIVDHSTISTLTVTGTSPLPVRNSIIARDFPFPTWTLGGVVQTLGHNRIGALSPSAAGQGGFVDGVNGDRVGTTANPLISHLGPLQDNGGPTATRAPLLGSPAVDAGDPVTFAPFDQRGIARPVGPAPDIGAFEGVGRAASLCNGDGGDQMGCADCPCGNNSAPGTVGGCLNSASSSARLIAIGDPSVTLPAMSTSDLRLSLQGATPSAFCILSSGDGIAPMSPSNPCFGLDSGIPSPELDGLRCAITNTRRHGGRSADAEGNVGVTNAPWGGEGEPPVGIALAGGGFVSGQTRYFQVINRDDPTAVCMRGLNTSQAVEVTFTP